MAVRTNQKTNGTTRDLEMKGMKKDTFRMEYPDMVSNKRQDIKVFQNRNDLIIKAENNKVIIRIILGLLVLFLFLKLTYLPLRQ